MWLAVLVCIPALVASLGVTLLCRPTRWINVIAAGLLAIAVVFGQHVLRAMLRHPERPRNAVVFLTIVTFALGAVAWIQFTDDRVTGRWSVYVLVAFVSALSLTMSMLRERDSDTWHRWTARVFVTLSVASVVVGAFLLAFRGQVIGAWLVLGGLLVGWPLTIGFASEHLLRDTRWRSLLLHRAAPLVASVVAAIGLSDLAEETSPLVMGIAAVVILLVVAALVVRLPLDTVAAAIIFAGVLPLAPLPAHELAVPSDTERPTLVFLGDSYASGEGSRTYFAGTTTQGVDTCRRSPDAYAVQVTERLGTGRVFLACSGAKTTGDPDDATVDHLDEQIAELATLDVDRVERVFFDVGGNDALFSTLITTCLAPGDCSDLREPVLRELENVRSKLRTTYAALQEAVEQQWGSKVPITVIPYPNPVAPNGCWWSGFSDDEHAFLHDFVRRLDDVVEHEAHEAGFDVVDGIEESFVGQRICDDARPGAAAINFFAFTSVEGFVLDQASPANWMHNSLHPNRVGHDLLTERILAWLDDGAVTAPLDDTAALGDVRVDEPRRDLGECGSNVATGAAELRRIDECAGELDTWALRESGQAALRVLLPIAFFVGGCWLFSLTGVARWRRRRGDV